MKSAKNHGVRGEDGIPKWLFHDGPMISVLHGEYAKKGHVNAEVLVKASSHRVVIEASVERVWGLLSGCCLGKLASDHPRRSLWLRYGGGPPLRPEERQGLHKVELRHRRRRARLDLDQRLLWDEGRPPSRAQTRRQEFVWSLE